MDINIIEDGVEVYGRTAGEAWNNHLEFTRFIGNSRWLSSSGPLFGTPKDEQRYKIIVKYKPAE
jgi:hypothetical protein